MHIKTYGAILIRYDNNICLAFCIYFKIIYLTIISTKKKKGKIKKNKTNVKRLSSF